METALVPWQSVSGAREGFTNPCPTHPLLVGQQECQQYNLSEPWRHSLWTSVAASPGWGPARPHQHLRVLQPTQVVPLHADSRTHTDSGSRSAWPPHPPAPRTRPEFQGALRGRRTPQASARAGIFLFQHTQAFSCPALLSRCLPLSRQAAWAHSLEQNMSSLPQFPHLYNSYKKVVTQGLV